MDRTQKKIHFAKIKKIFDDYSMLLTINNNGIIANDFNSLRLKLHKYNSNALIVNNNILNLAIKEKNYDSELIKFTKNPVCILYSNNPLDLIKILIDFCKKNNKINILYGYYQSRILNVNFIKTISALPSLDAIYINLCSTLMSPAYNLYSTINQCPIKLIQILQHHSKSN